MQWDKEIYNNLLISYTPQRGLLTDCVEHAAVLSAENFEILSSTQNFYLETYQIEQENEEGKLERIAVNEAEILNDVLSSGRVISKAGVRINREKYSIMNYDSYFQILHLKKPDGGACAIKTNKMIVFAS